MKHKYINTKYQVHIGYWTFLWELLFGANEYPQSLQAMPICTYLLSAYDIFAKPYQIAVILVQTTVFMYKYAPQYLFFDCA